MDGSCVLIFAADEQRATAISAGLYILQNRRTSRPFWRELARHEVANRELRNKSFAHFSERGGYPADQRIELFHHDGAGSGYRRPHRRGNEQRAAEPGELLAARLRGHSCRCGSRTTPERWLGSRRFEDASVRSTRTGRSRAASARVLWSSTSGLDDLCERRTGPALRRTRGRAR